MSSLRKKFPNCFVRVNAKNMPTVICGYREEPMNKQPLAGEQSAALKKARQIFSDWRINHCIPPRIFWGWDSVHIPAIPRQGYEFQT
jgi:hypothetical protein